MAASRSLLQPLLRHAAPHLSRRFFACRQCPLRGARPLASAVQATPSTFRQTPFLQAIRAQSTATAGPVEGKTAGTETLQDEPPDTAGDNSKEKTSSFPKTSASVVGWWLLGSAVSVYGLVVFGGLTRLTESGLSITEWRPVTGSLPPTSAGAWASEFAKYQRSPEFQKLNPHMTLAEFKRIYWMEWTHRFWGRAVGLTFLLPTLYFVARRRVSAPLARNLALTNALIVTQGCVGWWMVRSGLTDDLLAPHATPRVSQYRLATHLMLAFGTFTAMLWNGLQVFRERALLADAGASTQLLARLRGPALRPFRVAAALTAALVTLTAFSGAFVAGLDAGLIYNEFPYMGLGLAPPRSELLSPFYARNADQSDLLWRNAFENPSLAQLDHRVLAVSTFTAVNALALYARASPAVRAALPLGARRAVLAVCALVWLQAGLGLATLLYLVPTPLAAAHQAGALALLSGFTVLAARVYTPPRLLRLVRQRAAAASARRGPVAGGSGRGFAADQRS